VTCSIKEPRRPGRRPDRGVTGPSAPTVLVTEVSPDRGVTGPSAPTVLVTEVSPDRGVTGPSRPSPPTPWPARGCATSVTSPANALATEVSPPAPVPARERAGDLPRASGTLHAPLLPPLRTRHRHGLTESAASPASSSMSLGVSLACL